MRDSSLSVAASVPNYTASPFLLLALVLGVGGLLASTLSSAITVESWDFLFRLMPHTTKLIRFITASELSATKCSNTSAKVIGAVTYFKVKPITSFNLQGARK